MCLPLCIIIIMLNPTQPYVLVQPLLAYRMYIGQQISQRQRKHFYYNIIPPTLCVCNAQVSGQQPELPRKAALTEDSEGGGGKDSRRLDLGDDKELSVVSVTVHVPNDLHRSAQL